MPSVDYQAAHISLSDDFIYKIRIIGVPMYGLYALGAGRFEGVIHQKKLMEHMSPYL